MRSSSFLAAQAFQPHTIVLKTTNGGSSWITLFTSYSHPTLFDVDFVNADTGWTVGRYGTILKTTDGGYNWIDQQIDGTWWSSVSFLNGDIGWVSCVSNGTLMKTTNGGSSWTLLNMNNMYTPPVPGPTINLSSSSLNFGTRPANSTYDQTVTIENQFD